VVQIASPRAPRRLEIVRRAADVFRRKGYHAAGMREIADGLGLAPGALYYYFRSKEDLLYACQEETLVRLTAGARRIVAGPGDAEQRLRALIAFHVDLTLAQTGGSAAHVEFRALPTDRLRRVVRRRDAYERLVRRLLADGVEEGSFRDLDPKVAAWMVLGALNWTVVWWRPDGRRSAAEVAGAFADLMLRGLSARKG
jgi:AcrR family transcriptional regulator